MKPKTKNRILFGVGIALSVLVLSIAPMLPVSSIIVGSIFNGRASTSEDLSTNRECYIYKIRKDIPSLSSRTEFTFESDENVLTSYLYEVPNPKGLVIAAHGLTSQADGVDANYQTYFVEKGWDVLAVDLTASGKSEGKSHYLDQSAIDVANAVKAASKWEKTKNLKTCLVGHSWGAYGALASYEYESSPKAVASFASFIQPDLEMIDSSRKGLGDFADATKWCMDLGLVALRGSKGFLNAADALKKNSDAKVILVQGELDETVTSYSGSYYKSASFGNERTTPIYLKGRTHTDLFYSDAALTYKKDIVDPKLEELGDWNKLSLEDKKAFESSIDKEKTSELNVSLFDQIESIFAQAVA
ncbi:MAG: lysophospholipase [Bacilli bacterium]|nr:lysophospholipase [Bacilli bacterium]